MAWKALAAVAIAVGGAVTAFAVYTFGWHDSDTRTVTRSDPFVKTVKGVTGSHRVYTLRDGDYVRRPRAAVECLASQEGGFPNLVCLRIGGGRHTLIFYQDSVSVIGPDADPLNPSESFDWSPK